MKYVSINHGIKKWTQFNSKCITAPDFKSQILNHKWNLDNGTIIALNPIQTLLQVLNHNMEIASTNQINI